MRATDLREGERRRYPRVSPSAPHGPALARLRPGCDAAVVNLSRGGACVEARAPLRPGAPVEIRLTLLGWEWQGQAQVVRCYVAALPRDERVRYRAGLQFVLPVEGREEEECLPGPVTANG